MISALLIVLVALGLGLVWQGITGRSLIGEIRGTFS